MRILILITLLTFSTIGKSDPIYLDKGSVAPSEGILFPLEEAKSIRKELLEKDYFKEVNTSLNKSLDLYKSNELIYQSQKSLLIEQNDKLTKSLYSERQLSDTQKVLYFVGGVLVTGLAVYGASQLVGK